MIILLLLALTIQRSCGKTTQHYFFIMVKSVGTDTDNVVKPNSLTSRYYVNDIHCYGLYRPCAIFQLLL